MARRKRDFKRITLPDPKYGDFTLAKTINILMTRGKKSTAERAVYGALGIVAEKTGGDALEVFKNAIANIKPVVEVRSRRVGGATYQVPSEIRGVRAESLAIRWLIAAARQRQERGIDIRMASEILDASNNRGIAVKKKEDTHRMAEANKAFAHFRW